MARNGSGRRTSIGSAPRSSSGKGKRSTPRWG